jgi:hypothetical protein
MAMAFAQFRSIETQAVITINLPRSLQDRKPGRSNAGKRTRLVIVGCVAGHATAPIN